LESGWLASTGPPDCSIFWVYLLFSHISRMFLREYQMNSKSDLLFTSKSRTDASFFEENGKYSDRHTGIP